MNLESNTRLPRTPDRCILIPHTAYKFFAKCLDIDAPPCDDSCMPQTDSIRYETHYRIARSMMPFRSDSDFDDALEIIIDRYDDDDADAICAIMIRLFDESCPD